MFDRTQPSKRAKTWRADPGLLSHSSSRGFASTRWGDGDDGFMVDDIKRTKDGFALDEYAQVPLSPQAIKALKQLQALEPDENDGIYVDDIEAPEKFQIETWNANAHLPFVVDAYEFDDTELPVAQVEAVTETNTVVEIAADDADAALAVSADVELDETETEKAETTQAEESVQAGEANEQSDDEAITVEVADEEAQADVTAQAQEANQTEIEAEADVEVKTQADTDTQTDVETTIDAAETQAETQAETLAEQEAPVAQEATAEAESVIETENQAAVEVEATPEVSTPIDLTESDLADESTIAPEQMAASVEDVVDDVTLPEPVMAGIDPDVAEQREAEKFAEGLAQGIAQGERQAREAMQQEVQAQCTVLANVTQELHALLKDSKAFYEPLKRLSLHLAEQIVMGELRTSTQSIEQLIQRCLDELDHPAQGLVVLELNPEDKTRLQAQSPELIQGMRLEAVQDMQPGSVRLFANDTVIEDLVEHRLEALAQSLLVDVATWKAQSTLAKPEASTQDLESEDVHP